MPDLRTDMNDRERARFAAQAKAVADTASELAEALVLKDDAQVVVNIVVLGMMTNEMMEGLKPIILKALADAGAAVTTPEQVADADLFKQSPE